MPMVLRRQGRADTPRGGFRVVPAGVGLSLLVVLLTACGPEGPSTPSTPDAGSVATGEPGRLDAHFPFDAGGADLPDAGGLPEVPDADVTAADVPLDSGPGDTADDADSPVEWLEVIAVSPETGSTEGGTELLVIGLGFTEATDVFIGGERCGDVDVVDETKLRCFSPANPAGLYDVKVVTEAALATLEDAFRYVAPVRVEAVEPDRGAAEGGTPISALGSGLSPDAQVSIGGRAVLGLEWIDETELRGFTPGGEVGPQVVRVSDRTGLAELEGGFTYVTPLRLDAVLPGVGPSAGGGLAILTGAGLAEQGELTVWFGLLQAEVAAIVDDTRVEVRVPPGPPGSRVDVTVEAAAGGAATLREAYGYLDGLGEHALAQLWPTWGTTAGGTSVVLSGAGLGAAERVAFGGSEAELVEAGDDWLLVTAPPSAELGAVEVVVAGPDWEVALDDAFEYRPAVMIDAVEPGEGDVAGGTRVTLTGAGFEVGSSVRVGPLVGRAVEVLDGRHLAFTTPPGAVGAADVVVTVPDGRAGRARDAFRYTAEPQVFGLTPARGSLAGGTWVRVRGVGLTEPVSVTFGGVDVPELTVLDPSTVAVRTPAWADSVYVDVEVTVGDGDPLLVPDRYLYFDPASATGGVWGEPVQGALNVTVVSAAGIPLEGAFVMLDVRGESQYRGVTDARGQLTLSGPDLSGRQIVSATRPGYGSSSLYGVDAENVMLDLPCAHDGACVDNADCRSDLVCSEGLCLSPECITQQGTPPPSERGTITGQLTGLDKIGDPAPGELYLGAVWTTQAGPWSVGSVRQTGENIVLEDGPYTLTSRTGELAVVALCGFWDEETRVFRPMRMGIRRGLFVVDAETYEVDLECDTWLDQTLTIKATGAPLREEGPNIYRHQAFLDLGNEGYFGGVVNHEGTDTVLEAEGFARLEGPLADARYYVQGGAYTGYSWPYTFAFLRGVTDLDGPLVLPQLLPVARLTTPDLAAEDGPVLVGGYLEWSAVGDRQPDFWYLTLRDFTGITWWALIIPGDRSSVTLPSWPDDADSSLFPAGQLLLLARGVDALSFDMDDFDTNDFRSASWVAYSLAGWVIENP